MRIWSLHPRYLDRQGLVACWRETLLAQAVLAGRTRGYLAHPQLQRFRAAHDPLQALGAYLGGVADEADLRGYRFDRARIDRSDAGEAEVLPVTTGQVSWEWSHLTAKLAERSPDVLRRWSTVGAPEPHPLFRLIDGPIESWERPDPAR
ncbi:pyrimidine dimer DNA glycosylase/endonuclease V [Microbacterium sp. H83]|uniref:pyrimidine dimer DNA glycosylase/endonuclease V n=1 Tax=Microbacterium sp. H83 TaxID=1827324 RepID=UPI0007F523AD|nr:pyrimidine dimer DNA glycosylase/endonuclease V [Microbacterium sp. H83]OAN43337.1 pyrimidine dimer DNA glycosylase [Microbacterium sp. H83]